MKCAYCGMDSGITIVNGIEFCSNCGVSLNGILQLEQEIISYDDAKFMKHFDQGLMNFFKQKNNVSRSYENPSFMLNDTCPYCGKAIKPNEFYCTNCAEPIPIIKSTITDRKRPKTRKQIIREQFKRDRTSICPKCGSHSVKIYRKGYNWDEAFWGSVFEIKGSRYLAGSNSNDTMCQCNNCGHTWNSHL